MPLFEDLLSDETMLQEELSGEAIPRLIFRNRPVKPERLKVSLNATPQQFVQTELELFLNREEDIKHLEMLFRVCGYTDLRRLTSQLGKPKTEISLSFEARPQLLSEAAAELLPLKALRAFFYYETPFGQQPFLHLDLAYTLLKAQLKYE